MSGVVTPQYVGPDLDANAPNKYVSAFVSDLPGAAGAATGTPPAGSGLWAIPHYAAHLLRVDAGTGAVSKVTVEGDVRRTSTVDNVPTSTSFLCQLKDL